MLLFLLACSGGTTGTDTNTNPTTPDDSCVTDADCQDWEICGDEEECVVGDDNESLEDAEGILWEQTVTGHLQTEGDQDFYSFAADGAVLK